MPSVASGSKVVTRSVPAERMALTATPASTTVSREAPMRPASRRMSSAAASAPRNAATGRSPAAPGKKQANNSAAKPAPALTPTMLGLASGLSSTPCNMTPDTASAAPESMAASVRGRRM